MTSIKRVTVAGATGALGPAIALALSTAGYKVQMLSRRVSSQRPALPRSINLTRVDYTSKLELEQVLKGQDAVVSTLGDTVGAYAAQRALIEASYSVGVKRFMPSEFGSDTTNLRVRTMPFFKEKVRQQEMLKALSSSSKDFTWTVFVTGPFLDWGLGVVPFIINVGRRSAQLFDGGNVPFSTTRIRTVAQAVARSLHRFDETANRTLFVHDGVTTQNELISRAQSILQKHSDTTSGIPAASPLAGSGGMGFDVMPVNNAALETTAWKDYNTPGTDPLSWVFSFINLSLWSWDGGRGICQHMRTDNRLLRMRELNSVEWGKVLDEEILKAASILRQSQAISSACSLEAAESALIEGRAKLLGFEGT